MATVFPPDPEAPPPVKRPTWVVFHVRDQHGRLLEGLEAEVLLPDGRVHEERLGADARISLHDVKDDGACELVLRAPSDA